MSSLLNNKDLAEIDFNDIEELFAKLTPEEIQLLSDEVDPDVRLILLLLLGINLEHFPVFHPLLDDFNSSKLV